LQETKKKSTLTLMKRRTRNLSLLKNKSKRENRMLLVLNCSRKREKWLLDRRKKTRKKRPRTKRNWPSNLKQ